MDLAWILAMVVMAYDPFSTGGGGEGSAGGSSGGELPPGCLLADAVAHRHARYGDAVVPDIEPALLIIEPTIHLFFDRYMVHSNLLSKCKRHDTCHVPIFRVFACFLNFTVHKLSQFPYYLIYVCV